MNKILNKLLENKNEQINEMMNNGWKHYQWIHETINKCMKEWMVNG